MIDKLVDSGRRSTKFLKRLRARIKMKNRFEGEESEFSSKANVVVFWKASWNNPANH